MSVRFSRISRQSSGASVCSRWRRASSSQDALPHLGGGLARERDREDVARLHAGEQQPDVAIDQDARLAGAGRGFERDVAGRIDRERARLGVARARRPVARGKSSGSSASKSRRGCRSLIDALLLASRRRSRAGRPCDTDRARTTTSSGRPRRKLLPRQSGRAWRSAADPARRPAARRACGLPLPERHDGTIAFEREIQRFGECPLADRRGPSIEAFRAPRSCRSAAAAPVGGRASSSICSR